MPHAGQGQIGIVDYGAGLTSFYGLSAGAIGAFQGQTGHLSGRDALDGGGVQGAVSGSLAQGVLAAVTAADGTHSYASSLAYGGAYADRVELVSAHLGAGDFLVAAASDSAGLSVFSLAAGAPVLASVTADTAQSYADGITALAMADLGGRSFVFAGSSTESGITSYELRSDGSLARADAVGVDELVPTETVSDLQTVTVGGVDYLIAAGAGNSSLTVFGVNGDGTLVPTDHVVDDLGTRFQSCTTFDALTVGGRCFVVATGADDGLTLMELLPGGTLLHLQTIADSAEMALSDVSALRLVAVGGEVQLFVTSSDEAGMSVFRITLPDGIAAGSSGAALSGTSGADLLVQDGGAGHLSGGAGNDVLRDGTGADTLTGGTGADIFVLTADGADDRITDFEVGVDRIDLSLLPGLRNMGQIEIAPIMGGAILRYETEILTVLSADGRSLTAADFANAGFFGLTHFDVSLGTRVFIPPEQQNSGPDPAAILRKGNGGNNRMIGTAADETFVGRGGNDRFEGRGGHDYFDGGGGFDMVSYASEGASVTVDLGAAQMNAGAAAGNNFRSVEGIIGTDLDDSLTAGDDAARLIGRGGNDVLRGHLGADTLRGGAGDDVLSGLAGDDRLRGNGGNDTLHGGEGNDVLDGGEGDDYLSGLSGDDSLLGGAGADTLSGGDGNDTMRGGDGSDALFGGDGGDRLSGQGGDDTISGGAGDDRLGGGGGADQLFGEDGNDRLAGGGGSDMLIGGAGADTLIGNGGRDSFVFLDARDSGPGSAARDVITDFRPGTDLIDLSALDGGSAPGDQALVFIGRADFSGAEGELRFARAGAATLIEADLDGDGQADLQILLTKFMALHDSDFLL
ncbi:MAG: M10 family metallopeptidase C-terminal domain-containing protein [Defluviimonas sp.]|uniref:M10 family metallopeptidase C-terminal domain-containing protein n=1 Tax=Albidovulum sp. TaxID=1872424 RepID=UPI002A315BBE|nr:M10 family metallopeptidase C-terminal domain-containing protein [Defluviimonas sp.]